MRRTFPILGLALSVAAAVIGVHAATHASAATATQEPKVAPVAVVEVDDAWLRPVYGAGTLGPMGLGALKIGSAGPVHAGRCATTSAAGWSADYNGSYGLVALHSRTVSPLRTPENVGVGSTLGQVKKAYPGFATIAMPRGTGSGRAASPTLAGTHYTFVFTKGVLTTLGVESDDHPC